MPRTGETIRNRITTETITFVRTAADTGGDAVELLFAVTGGGEVPAAHVHPRQTETFEIHEGRCRVVIDGVESVAGPGEVVAVPPGVAHAWGAMTDVKMTVTLEPALRADEFFVDLFALTNGGYADAKGLPRPLTMAALCHEYRDLVYLAAAPAWVQKAAFAVLGRIGRALGRGPGAAAPALAAA
jgi:quercetin dioxygenase-like cupin family protein